MPKVTAPSTFGLDQVFLLISLLDSLRGRSSLTTFGRGVFLSCSGDSLGWSIGRDGRLWESISFEERKHIVGTTAKEIMIAGVVFAFGIVGTNQGFLFQYIRGSLSLNEDSVIS